MNKEELDKVTGHNYDGIQEYDNPLPSWWLATFYITIIFAVLYFIHFQLGSGLGSNEELAKDIQEVEMQKHANGGGSSVPTEALLAAAFQDTQKLSAGKQVFAEKCLACHAADGGGGIGPNLTDKFWIHGDGKLPSIAKVVSEGVADKGMPPWGSMLKPEELVNVAVYVKSLQGTHPANPKAPQGIEVKN